MVDHSITDPLDYSSNNTGNVVRRRLRRLLVGIAVCLILYEGARCGFLLQHYLRQRYWLQQCLRHSNASQSPLVVRDDPWTRPLSFSNPVSRTDPASKVGKALQRNDDVESWNSYQRLAIYQPIAWRELLGVAPTIASFHPTLFGTQPIVFLGERSSADGSRWLVVISGSLVSKDGLGPNIPSMTVRVPSFFSSLKSSPNVISSDQTTGSSAFAELGAGVADQNDPSLLKVPFTIRNAEPSSQCQNESGYLECRVDNNGALVWKICWN